MCWRNLNSKGGLWIKFTTLQGSALEPIAIPLKCNSTAFAVMCIQCSIVAVQSSKVRTINSLVLSAVCYIWFAVQSSSYSNIDLQFFKVWFSIYAVQSSAVCYVCSSVVHFCVVLCHSFASVILWLYGTTPRNSFLPIQICALLFVVLCFALQ